MTSLFVWSMQYKSMYKKVSCYCRVTVIRSGIFIFISNSGACLVVVELAAADRGWCAWWWCSLFTRLASLKCIELHRTSIPHATKRPKIHVFLLFVGISISPLNPHTFVIGLVNLGEFAPQPWSQLTNCTPRVSGDWLIFHLPPYRLSAAGRGDQLDEFCRKVCTFVVVVVTNDLL